MPTRDNIIMRKCQNPKRVSLPDGKTFLARYERVTRDHLPPNVRMRRRYKQIAAPKVRRRHRDQRGWGISSIFRFAKKLAKNPIVRNIGKMVLQELPGVYDKGVKRIKNKKLKKTLDSDIGHLLVNMGSEYGQSKL